MNTVKRPIAPASVALVMFAFVGLVCPAFAQSPPELDRLVQRIALYPDPLLSQVLAAATYSDEIRPAAEWANRHSFLHGEALARGIEEDRLPWDPSVQALLPFPSVLDMMARDPGWTRALGEAFLAEREAVMDSVQRLRHYAYDYGYLRGNDRIVVRPGPYIEIAPVNPEMLYVPVYDPGIVFFRPRPGFRVGAAISFGPFVSLGVAFRPWGWGNNRFDWGGRRVIINDHEWGRTVINRNTYVHPYEGPRRYRPEERRPEGHDRGRER